MISTPGTKSIFTLSPRSLVGARGAKSGYFCAVFDDCRHGPASKPVEATADLKRACGGGHEMNGSMLVDVLQGVSLQRGSSSIGANWNRWRHSMTACGQVNALNPFSRASA